MELLSAKDEIRNIQIVNEYMCQKNQEMEETLRNLAVEILYLELRSIDAGLWGHLYMTKEELLAMDKNQLAAKVIAASLPRHRKFDAIKDENYWHTDLIKFLQQKISTLERKCGTLEEQCQIESGENKKQPVKNSKGRGRNRRPVHRERHWTILKEESNLKTFSCLVHFTHFIIECSAYFSLYWRNTKTNTILSVVGNPQSIVHFWNGLVKSNTSFQSKIGVSIKAYPKCIDWTSFRIVILFKMYYWWFSFYFHLSFVCIIIYICSHERSCY